MVVYKYDAAGNIASQTTVVPTALNITNFSPSQGSAGATVVISGTGFSTTPNANTVRFNGVAGAVTSATQTQLAVIVPNGAVSGPISVTMGSNTVTSARNFAAVQGPTISGFSPSIVDVGGSVTLLGSNLYPAPNLTKLLVGTTQVSISTISAAQAVFTLPSSVSSGAIQAITLYGQAISASDLIIAPSGVGAANVTSLSTITANGNASSLNVSQAGKYGAISFKATAGQYLTVQLSNFTTSPSGNSINYQIYSPSNVSIASGVVSASSPSIHLPVIATTGDHLVTFTSSNATFRFSALLEVNANVVVDGTPTGVATTGAGQTTRFTFQATAGENLGIGIGNLVKTNGSASYGSVIASIYKPDGSYLQEAFCFTAYASCDTNLTAVPATGVYSVVVESPSPSSEPNLTMSFTVTASHDVVKALSNSATMMSLNRVGQNGRFSFTGTAGTTVAVQLSSISTTPAERGLELTVLKPDGSTLTSTFTTGGYTFNLANLPATGTYTVFVDPKYGAMASVSVAVRTSSSVTITMDGASSNVSTALGGAYAYFSFSATAADNLGIGIANLVKTNGSSYSSMRVSIYKPDGSYLQEAFCFTAYASCDTNLTAVPATGVYSVIVQSSAPSLEPNLTMSFTVTVSHDAVKTLSNNGTTMSLSRAGQNGRFTFSRAAGSAASIQLSSISTTPSGQTVYFTVYKPDGTSLSSGSSASGYTFSLTNLPATGTYTLFVDPQYGATATLQGLVN